MTAGHLIHIRPSYHGYLRNSVTQPSSLNGRSGLTGLPRYRYRLQPFIQEQARTITSSSLVLLVKRIYPNQNSIAMVAVEHHSDQQ